VKLILVRIVGEVGYLANRLIGSYSTVVVHPSYTATIYEIRGSADPRVQTTDSGLVLHSVWQA